MWVSYPQSSVWRWVCPWDFVAGYYRGIAETLIMRCADVFMSFPAMVLILVLVSVLGPSVATVTIVIGVLGWPKFARLIYGNVAVGQGTGITWRRPGPSAQRTALS